MKSFVFALAVALAPPLHACAQIPGTNISSGHNLLQDNSQCKIPPGSIIDNFSFRNTRGKPYYLNEIVAKGPSLFVFMSSTCPLAKRYTSRLIRLHQKYAKKGVSFFAVFPNTDDSLERIQEFCQTVKYPFPSVKDFDGYVTRKLDATMTPQVFLIDSQRRLRYRGAIDDNRVENRVKKSYLNDAISALMTGSPIERTSTQAMGCTIHRDDDEKTTITYSGHIARILQDNCMSCHREGQVAPFALTNYEETKRFKQEIMEYTQARLMPPWKASKGVAKYKNDISLNNDEIAKIKKWVEQGAPLGNRNQISPPPKFSDDWALGKPDLVVEMPEEYVIGAEGEDDYRHFVVPYEAVKDKFITAVDVQPGNRSVVHHVLAYFDTTGAARKLDAAADGPGYSRFGDIGFQPTSILGGWAPGKIPTPLPLGSGLWLPKKGDIILQVHYYRSGVEERDKTKIGFYFSKHPQTVPARTAVVENRDFVIPKNHPRFQVIAKHTLQQDSYVYSVTPHMHLIGKKLTFVAKHPDGKVTRLIKIDNWDFNWQLTYHLKELYEFPKGTELQLIATYDNTDKNPNNPYSPPREIRYGEKTTEEMCVAFVGLLHKSQYEPWKNVINAKGTRSEPTQVRH